ncbi:CotH kinase family protein [Telluribacter sp. SYSU D00476]|uniref:CotH kinase family protein n=1 Tax=Telluribacter sp. SYSU D00476 TaxID=2811430 RepID=UPI001FF6BCE5|nr:CotH kinase family protein [Telluribacter sp. SYSU D00476]
MKIPLLLASAVLLYAEVQAQQLPTSSNLPIVVIKTSGQTIVDDPKITADMGIIYNGSGVRNNLSDPFNHYNGKIGIELRGNSSQLVNQEKKAYGFETRNADGSNLNVSLLGMPSENDWILFGAFDDETYMRDALTHTLFRNMGHYSSRIAFVELYLTSDNTVDSYSEYRGIYILMEKIKRDANRVNISNLEYKDSTGNALTGGYIVKIDHHVGNPGPYWDSQFPNECGDFRTDFELHFPEDEAIHPAHLTYIRDYLHQFETALHGEAFKDPVNGYRKYINVSTFIDYFLLSEVVRSADAYSHSTFMYKQRDSRGGKLSMGPMWDYNASMGNTPWNFCDANDTEGWQYQSQRLCRTDRKQPFWWKRFMDDPAFVAELQARWQSLRSGVLQTATINGIIDQFIATVSEAQPRDYQRWNVTGERGNFPTEIAYLKSWLNQRLTWMDQHVPNLGNYVRFSGGVTPTITCEQPAQLLTYSGQHLEYQWKLNNTPIANATQSTYTATQPGTYTVAVTLAGNCYTEPLSTPSISRIVRSIQNGNWQSGTTWACGTIPTSLDEVTIQSGHIVQLDNTGSAFSLKLEESARIVLENSGTIGLSSNQ